MTEVDSLDLITDRLITIVGAIPGILLADNKYPDTLTASVNLPFAFIEEPGEATYQMNSAHTLATTREWFLLFYIQEFTQGDESSETTAREVARTFVRRVGRYLFQHIQLQTSTDQGVGNAFVYHADLNRDYSIESTSRHSRLFSCFAFRLSVTELDDVSE